MGRVFAICTGAKKGTPKHMVARAYLRENHGVVGDCHAGAGHRQVSILAQEDVLALQKMDIEAEPGDFAENVVIEGMSLAGTQVGSRLQIGDTLLEITELGKPEWKKGDYSFEGVALVARSGLFARVIQGGWIAPGDAVVVV